ncbi:hypothetical protein [Candidatus Weimeria sp. HCP3S3_B5]|uniref:hypothetical protein n=1 Tax=Candidatus Weimeria sp. HCP3S3_B5 TaxID=3438871 RepID=UPI003F8A6BBE
MNKNKTLKRIITLFVMAATITFGTYAGHVVSYANQDTLDRKSLSHTTVITLDGIRPEYLSKQSSNITLNKDWAMSTGVGTVYSIGQIVDLSKYLPSGSTITDITLYCPRSEKVTQSKFTTINNYELTNKSTNNKTTVRFWRTDNPSSSSRTSYFNGDSSNTKFYIRIQGSILQQYTGMDGFTVYGSKMIVQYR